MKNKFLIIVSTALVSALALTGCATEESADSTAPTSSTEREETSGQETGAEETGTPETTTPETLSSLALEELFALITDEVDEDVLASLILAVEESASEADSKGLVEVRSTETEEVKLLNFLSAGAEKGISFVETPSGGLNLDTMARLENKALFTLYGVKQVLDLGFYTGVRELEDGKIALSIESELEESPLRFIYIVEVDESGLVSSAVWGGEPMQDSVVFTSVFEYREDPEATQLFDENMAG